MTARHKATMTLEERLDYAAASGYAHEICAEAAAEIRRLQRLATLAIDPEDRALIRMGLKMRDRDLLRFVSRIRTQDPVVPDVKAEQSRIAALLQLFR